jgi:hypothetical protein
VDEEAIVWAAVPEKIINNNDAVEYIIHIAFKLGKESLSQHTPSPKHAV